MIYRHFVLRAMLLVKKLKPGLVASYDIRHGNGQGLFLFLAFNKFVTYLLT